MPRPPMKLAALIALCAASSAAGAAELYVICHSDVTLAAADVRDVFLGEKQFSGGLKLLPADNSAVQEEFLARVLKMQSAKYSTLWIKKSFRDGANPPPTLGSDVESLEYVRRTPGACSYLSTKPPRDVTTISEVL